MSPLVLPDPARYILVNLDVKQFDDFGDTFAASLPYSNTNMSGRFNAVMLAIRMDRDQRIIVF